MNGLTLSLEFGVALGRTIEQRLGCLSSYIILIIDH